MTPEFEKAVRLTEQDHFNDVAGELGRVKSSPRLLRHTETASGITRR